VERHGLRDEGSRRHDRPRRAQTRRDHAAFRRHRAARGRRRGGCDDEVRLSRWPLALAAAAVAVTGIAVVPGVSAGPSLPRIDHVVVIVFENKSARQILRSPEAPTFRALAERYALLSRYDAVAHPSLPNYLALVGGSTFGIRRDCIRCRVASRSLADVLSGAGRSSKAYVEGLSGAV